MRATVVAFIAYFALVNIRHVAANEHEVWAIVPAGQNSGEALADLLTVSLSSVDGMRLVEREQIGAALNELTLASCGDVADAQTLKLGEFLAADVVILVEQLRNGDEPTFRL